MTPNKQVSPVIRISQGERDASARATHLEAATRKFLVTTNERKQMSTKTNFKRIALVAVAALGLGVLSSVPSQAIITGVPTITTVNGTATKAIADSTTAGTITLKWNATDADTFSVAAYQSAGPSTNSSNNGRFYRGDTLTAFTTTSPLLTLAISAAAQDLDSVSALIGSDAQGGVVATRLTGARAIGAAGANSLTLKFQLDSLTARSAGTYTYNITATPFTAGVAVGGTSGIAGDVTKTVSASISITVAALTTESLVASAANSTAFISTTASTAAGWTAPTTDAQPAVLATASTTPRAYIYVNLKNAAGTAASESITITTNVGSIGTTAANVGKSVTLQYASSAAQDFAVYSDGTAGVATITVKSTTVTFASKTVTFYSAAPTSIVATVQTATLGAGSNSAAVTAVAKDANGAWGGTLYAYTSSTALVSDSATACAYVAANGRHECTLTGVAAGSPTITLRDTASTGSATIASTPVTVTVSVTAAATVKLTWNKASYAPGEKATLSVSVLDSAGKDVAGGTKTNIFTTGGISLSTAAGNGSDTTTAVTLITSSPASEAAGTSTANVKNYTIYMPTNGGTITATATGGTGLPVAGQVEVKATATITNDAAAALAAVTALATTVASLKTLITTLTNLVLKIQKKVKA